MALGIWTKDGVDLFSWKGSAWNEMEGRRMRYGYIDTLFLFFCFLEMMCILRTGTAQLLLFPFRRDTGGMDIESRHGMLFSSIAW
jgi:hypothetical protein